MIVEDGESHHVPIVQASSETGGSDAVGALSVAGVNAGEGAPTEDTNEDSGLWDMVLTRV